MVHIFQHTIFRFISIILLQILLFNNIVLFDHSVPYIYLLLILILPFETNKILLLFIGFLTGFLIDMSFSSYGVHTGATVLIAFLRPAILRWIIPRGGYMPNTQPLLKYYGFAWFFKYAAFTIIIHHFALFFLFTFSFEALDVFMIRMLINSGITLFLIVLSQYFIFRT
ncbi:MAG: hypothetical protein R6U95_09470 [Bacteroidales bacterium]